MAGQDYGSGVAPFKRAIKSLVLSDGTGTPVTLSIPDFDGNVMASIPQRVSVSYKPNGRRPSGGPIAVETDDQEFQITIKGGLKSWVGATAHTPIEFMRGETVNSVALTSVSSAGKFMFQADVTYDNSAENQGGASQAATYAYCELMDAKEEEVDGLMYFTATVTVHENAPTFA